MRKNLLMSVCLSAAVLSAPVFASEGILRFTGNVVEPVCSITPAMDISMGDIMFDQPGNVGEKTPSTMFNMTFEQCPEAVQSLRVKFEGVADKNDNTLFQLDNIGQPGSASGIALEIKDAKQKVIIPGEASDSWVMMGTPGTNQAVPFSAAFKVTDNKVASGVASVSVQFSIIYN